ncbi:sugar phosphate isomerase/epimerase [Collimonas sp.]|jgi:sugar phosphate isomerase/epimerase|uniref:sugar phosphate isomerase/epimerase family protein n=1 Tax=Collimonas sp. TaxID=1963772 RepID=UPI002CC73FD5|nr:sugar phosphate isomerase/epimerase [Collimonas sp.]HWW07213.1 sugar phosphate isomerase/epimerase [Collimonas sp.]
MKLSVQLYSLRAVGDFDAQLAMARRAGFAWVEPVASTGLTPQEFANALQQHEVQAASMHASLQLLETQIDHVIASCRASGCTLVVMPWLPVAQRPLTAAGWRRLGVRLAGIGRQLQAHGIRLAYHNHDFEFLRYDGKMALELLFEDAAAEDLGWEADLGWLVRAGADPMTWINRMQQHLLAVHAKDIAADGGNQDQDGWCVLGQGVIPWRELLPELKSRVNLIVYEHDLPQEHERTIAASLAFMRRILG